MVDFIDPQPVLSGEGIPSSKVNLLVEAPVITEGDLLPGSEVTQFKTVNPRIFVRGRAVATFEPTGILADSTNMDGVGSFSAKAHKNTLHTTWVVSGAGSATFDAATILTSRLPVSGAGSFSAEATKTEAKVLRTIYTYGDSEFRYPAWMNIQDFGTYNKTVTFRIRQGFTERMSPGISVTTTSGGTTKAVAPLLEEVLMFPIGSGIVATGAGGINTVPWNATVEKVTLSVVTSTSSSITVDVNTGASGATPTSVFGAQSKPTISSPANYSVTTRSVFDNPNLVKGNIVTVDVDSGGSDVDGVIVEVLIRRKGGQ